MHPKNISINDFIYHLPTEKIALHPLEKRDQSKLLIYKEGEIKEDTYKNISDHLPSNSLLIFNNTKVIPARILFKKETGGTIEIFCLEPFEENTEYTTMMSKTGSAKWKCMIGGASKWKEGGLIKKIKIRNEEVEFTATLKQKLADAYLTDFSWQPSHYSFSEIIEQAGEIPLPPYIKRDVEEDDKERYQTIYAEHKGSVAAPTAGLHFTHEVFSSFENKNIEKAFVTLHVGAGTFKPVKSETMQQHEMHAEWMEVSTEFIELMLKNIKREIICIGTTSVRTIESLYWMGVKTILDPNQPVNELAVKQWEVYEKDLLEYKCDPEKSLTSLLQFLQKKKLTKLFIQTQIIITPGYRFKLTRGLVTNFHQPKSTLLLLIAAIARKDWKRIYEYALKNEFRFLSYGDGCLIFNS